MTLKFLIIFFLSTSCTFAQDMNSDFAKVYHNYLSKNSYAMDVISKSYLTKNDTDPEIEYGKMLKNGKQFYANFDNQQIIKNESYSIMINHHNKWLMFFENENKQNKNEFDQYKKFLEQKIPKEQIKYKGQVGNIKTYAISTKEEFISSALISIDIKNNFVKKITYFFKQENNSRKPKSAIYKTEIEYLFKTYRSTRDDIFFDTSKYITGTKTSDVKLKPTYKTYRLVTNANK